MKICFDTPSQETNYYAAYLFTYKPDYVRS